MYLALITRNTPTETKARLATCGALRTPSIKSSALNIVTKARIKPYDIKYIPKISPVEIFLSFRQNKAKIKTL